MANELEKNVRAAIRHLERVEQLLEPPKDQAATYHHPIVDFKIRDIAKKLRAGLVKDLAWYKASGESGKPGSYY